MREPTLIPPFNRKAIIAFVAALFALISLCIGLAPIPFLGLICYPSALLLGIVAVVLGVWSQYEMRMTGEGGRTLALISVWMGGFTLLAVACLIAIGVLVIPRIYDYLSQFLNQHDLNPF
jgi:hypothetical protein